MAFASDETLERHQVKVHGAEPSEELKKKIEEEKKAEEDELDVMDMDDGGMDFGSDSEDEVVPLPVINKPSIGAGKMAAIKANMAKANIVETAGNQIRIVALMLFTIFQKKTFWKTCKVIVDQIVSTPILNSIVSYLNPLNSKT